MSAAFDKLCNRAGIELFVPARIDSLCCGTPWKSKGMVRGATAMRKAVIDELLDASDGGRLPIVCDASSCTEGLRELVADTHTPTPLRIIDVVSFVFADILPKLTIPYRLNSLALHPTCSSTRLGLNQELRLIAESLAKTVVVPESWACCAFAGDRGMLHPELTASATADEVKEINRRSYDGYVSCNRTCEIGMSRASGKPYRHILELLLDLSEGS